MKNLYTYGMQAVQRTLTVGDLQAQRGKRKFTQVTADNAREAAAAVSAGIDTLSCGLNEYAEVRGASPNTLIITALPQTEFISETEILRAGLKAMEAGSDAIFTGRALRFVESLAREGIPVMSHLGMSPRKNTSYRGLRALGKTADEAMLLYQQFRDLENAGAFAAEVELVADEALREIGKRSNLVTFTLGSGSSGDVVFLYSCDVFGEVERVPRHAKAYADLHSMQQEIQSTRVQAYRSFQADVEAGLFPEKCHAVSMPDKELKLLKERLDSV